MIELIGYMGMISIMLSVIPQLIKTIKEGHANGLSLGYLALGEIGLLSLLIYVILSSASIPLIINYTFNVVSIGIILYYKVRK